MINNNELRLGNLLQDLVSSEWMRVTGIAAENVEAELLDRSKFPLPDGWEMGPIKLTPEILEKVFGAWEFGEDGTMFSVRAGTTEIDIFLQLGEIRLEGQNGTSFFITAPNGFYVHDLQNIGFWLNGKQELPVNLDYATQRDKKADI